MSMKPSQNKLKKQGGYPLIGWDGVHLESQLERFSSHTEYIKAHRVQEIGSDFTVPQPILRPRYMIKALPVSS